MFLCWYKTGISAMVLIIMLLAALGLHGSDYGISEERYTPKTMQQSTVLITEEQI